MPSLFSRVEQSSLSVCITFLLAMLGALGLASCSDSPSSPYQVSQRGRDFQPNQISISRGQTVRIVNDDADLLHHVYVTSEKFNYDSSDMLPGSKVDIKFPVAGDFNVLCGIHPKMKLGVHVE